MKSTRVMLIHRNRLFVDCLQSVLAVLDGFSVTVLVDSNHGAELAGRCDFLDSDVILLDATSCRPNPQATVERIRSFSNAAIIMVVATLSRQVIQECISANIAGCILEESSLADLTATIRKVSLGESSFPPEFVNEAFALLGSLARNRLIDQVESCDLTARELEVMQLIAWERLSNKQIAARLCVSVYTVKNHIHNIIEKLGVCDRYEAAKFAEKKRWLTLMPSR